MRVLSPQPTVWSLGVVLLTACSSNSGTTTPTPTRTMAMLGGDNQLSVPGSTVGIPPAVKLTDLNGQPVSGITVTFAAIGQGALTGAMPVTGSDGIATLGTWIPGELGTHSVTASAIATNNSPITFTATVVGPASITYEAGLDQRAPVGMAVAVPPAIQVVEVKPGGGPLVGITVTFAVTEGGGSVTGATAKTDTNGVATVGSWTLGPVIGTNRLTATLSWPLSPSITFTAAATASIRE